MNALTRCRSPRRLRGIGLFCRTSTTVFSTLGDDSSSTVGAPSTVKSPGGVHMSRLLVYAPGLGKSPDNIDGLYTKLQHDPDFGPPADTQLFKYRRPLVLRSRGRLARRCETLAEQVDAYTTGRDFDDIILIGHSAGGVMVRYAYLWALGGDGRPAMPWAERVSRIVLLAAPNRGFHLDEVTSVWQRQLAKMIAPLPLGLTAVDMIAGSAFISDLRIRWIRATHAPGAQVPVVIQLLGEQDDLVGVDDSGDIQGSPTGVQKLLPGATHTDIVSVADQPGEPAGQRYAILRWAILDPTIDTAQSTAGHLSDEEASANAIVFALHGIRCSGADWPERLKTVAERPDQPADRRMFVVTPSYGRMSAFNFALTKSRRKNLRWFADQYTYYLARQPEKPFHFVGHSNGTYMVGESFKSISSLKFNRVFLAGSVLPAQFNWQPYTDQGRIDTIVNVCATQDTPVAILCRTLRGFGMRDVGVGGFTGFDVFPGRQIRWITGDHGAALHSDERIGNVLTYLAGQDAAPLADAGAEPANWFGVLSRTMPYLGWGLVLLIAGAAVMLWPTMHGSAVALPTIAGVLALVYVALKVG
jgi:triacylglycerol esterase/lipase EstA (alpha/beta hydrolase family)